MTPSTIAIYAVCVLIWGTTWIMIKYQLGEVALQASLTYRFTIAAAVLLIYALVTRRRLRINRRHWFMVAAQGILMFSVNYYFVYWGAEYITSGLIAVLFTTLVIMNSVNERVLFGIPLHGMALLAGLCCVVGVGLIFWPEVNQLSTDSNALRGMALILAGAYAGSLGNMAAMKNSHAKLPVIAVNLYGMVLGTIASALFALATGVPFGFDTDPRYWGSLLYLSIPGTAIAFCLYFELINRIGASKAAYVSILLPVVALLMSTLFEGYQWSIAAVVGLSLALGGNALALSVKTPGAPRPRA
ncbi:MAG: DMT family transporter [Pseudomonadota bacterium]